MTVCYRTELCYVENMKLQRDVKPITYLKNRTTDVVQQVSQGRTMVITQNGEAKMVIMGVEEYDRLQSALALLKIVQQSEADIKRGRTIPQQAVFERIEDIIEKAKRALITDYSVQSALARKAFRYRSSTVS